MENNLLNKNKEINKQQKHVERAFKILSAIKQTLKVDAEAKQPLFLKVKESFVYNIIKNILSKQTKALLISITGESASGKTTFVQNAIKAYPSSLDGGIYTTINCDDYFYDTSKELEEAGSYEALFSTGFSFDTPDAVNLQLMKTHLQDLKNDKTIQSPTYNFVTCESSPNGEIKKPALLILNEGLYTLHESLRDITDVKVYIFTPFDIIKERWYKRAESRGKTGKAADMQFDDVNKTAQQHIRPTMEYADVVLNGLVSQEYITQIIQKIFSDIQNILTENNT